MTKPTLTTERLILRQVQMSDAERIATLAGAFEVAEYTLNMPHPYEPYMATEWITGVHNRTDDDPTYTFAISQRTDQQLIGMIGFTVDERHNKTEIGYWIGKRYWGNGYTTEAAQAIVDYCFGTLELNRVEATYYASNTRSKRVMGKIGMSYEGTQRQAIVREIPALNYRKVHDLGMYAILREDWLKNRG
ncbi:MAG: GNAT family N-acetyltransferase [Chloroflexota bacterium]